MYALINSGTVVGWLVADHIAGGWGDIGICVQREGRTRTGRRILIIRQVCDSNCGQDGGVSLPCRRTVAIGQRIWQWLR